MSNYDHIGMLHDTAGNLVAVRYSIYDAGPDGQDWIDGLLAVALRDKVRPI
jgi:hypothetical protein